MSIFQKFFVKSEYHNVCCIHLHYAIILQLDEIAYGSVYQRG